MTFNLKFESDNNLFQNSPDYIFSILQARQFNFHEMTKHDFKGTVTSIGARQKLCFKEDCRKGVVFERFKDFFKYQIFNYVHI